METLIDLNNLSIALSGAPGFNRVKAMTGCMITIDNNKTLTFRGIKGCRKYNTVHFIYEVGTDLFTIKLCKITFKKYIPVISNEKEIIGLYIDQLKEIIERETGLYLSL